MEAINPALAFEAADTDPKAHISLCEMLGISDERGKELCVIVNDCYDEAKTHSEAYALLSQKARTPQELMLLAQGYANIIDRRHRQPSHPLIDLLESMDGVQVIRL